MNPDVEISTGPVTPEMLKTAADSLLPIVQSQRERFRMRATELEAVRLLFFKIFTQIKVTCIQQTCASWYLRMKIQTGT